MAKRQRRMTKARRQKQILMHVAVVVLLIAAVLLVIALVVRGRMRAAQVEEPRDENMLSISELAEQELREAEEAAANTATLTPTPTPTPTPLVDEEQTEEEIRADLSALSIEDLAVYLREQEVPEELIEFMMEYPEAREFVTDYLYQPDMPPSKDISGEVRKGTIPHFLQWDERWGYEEYGGTFLAVSGCGPTAMSEVYSGLTGKTDMNPYEMAKWADEMGYHVPGQGTSWEMMWSGANKLGLNAWEVNFTENDIAYTLQQGYPIIAAMSPGDFTHFGHFIVLTGIDDAGNVSVRDSNSIVRTERTWTLEELMWQMSSMWAYSYTEYEETAW